jgi:Secretion system C-terminal sorting domain/Immunoglobulin domain/PKD-like domain
MLKKYDFDYNSIGANPTPLVKDSNNKIFGGLYSINDSSYPNQYGSVYEYDLTTDMLTVLHVVNPFAGDNTRFLRNISLKATDGNFYGISQECMYKFNPLTNNITNIIPIDQTGDLQEPIEICRKPAYHEITTTTFTPCVGSAFTYDIQNTNATSYAWSQNGTVLPTQTTGILTIPSIAITDSGTYTCTMSNECGTTVTMPLQITASCLSVDDITANSNSLKLYPNPARNILNIKLPDNKNFDIQKITITNMLGQTVFSDTKNFTKVEVSKLPIGIYDVVLKTDKGDWSGKFVKE